MNLLDKSAILQTANHALTFTNQQDLLPHKFTTINNGNQVNSNINNPNQINNNLTLKYSNRIPIKLTYKELCLVKTNIPLIMEANKIIVIILNKIIILLLKTNLQT